MTISRRRTSIAVLVAAVLSVLLLATRAFASAVTPVLARAEILEDATASLSAVDIASSPDFRPLDRAKTNHGYTSSAFWLRLVLENPSPRPESVIVELSATPTRVEVYDASGTRLVARSGSRLPFYERPIPSANLAFRFSIAEKGVETFLFRLEARDTLQVDPVIWQEDAFWAAQQRQHLIDGVYYGIILGLAIYNLLLAIFTRERAYLAYVGFQVAIATTNAAFDKYTFRFLWPAHPVWAARSEAVFDSLSLAAAMLCARWMLDTKKLAPTLDRIMSALGAIALAMALFATTRDATPREMLSIAAMVFFGVTLLVVAAATVARAGSLPGRIILAAWSLLFLATCLAALEAIGVLDTLAGYDLLKLGSGAEAILLAIGLAARIRTMQAERARAREDLLAERSRRVEALSRLVAGLAHELANPLNFAKGGLGALNAASPQQERALSLVRSGLERMERILDHLRADLGGRQARATRVDVRVELSEALEMLDVSPRAMKVAVEDETNGADICVLARRGDLAQVFGNLAKNAADAMADAGASTDAAALVVKLARERGPGDEDVLAVTFRDQGPGVPAEVRSSIFEPFFSTRASTGLGLYVAREIVARWGGTLTLAEDGEDAQSRGATFVVRVPLATGEPQSSATS